MKKLFIVLLLLTLSSGANAADLVWDASTGVVDKYYIYYGTESGKYPDRRDAGNVVRYNDIETKLRLLPGTKYFFALTAANSSGETKEMSNEASYTTPIKLELPGNVTITIDTH